jgi:hypothetical protein
MPDNAIRIEGLRELERAFRLYGRGLEKGLREAMEAGAEVVRPDAQSLTRSVLKPAVNVDWSLMRVGVTRRVAYVAPVQRGNRSRRPSSRARGEKFKRRVIERALEPALDRNVSRVEREFDDALDDLARMWSRV